MNSHEQSVPDDGDSSRDVHLIFELGSMRHVARTWQQFGGVPLANDAEHSFRVAWIALLLATREGADVGKVLEMALLHDVPETRTGDVNYLTRLYVSRNEKKAIDDSFAATTLRSRVEQLWKEWVEQESLESHVVKDADMLDCDFELAETAAIGFRLQTVLNASRHAARVKLRTSSAQELFDLIYSADPNEWHTAGPNRLNRGDWSPDT